MRCPKCNKDCMIDTKDIESHKSSSGFSVIKTVLISRCCNVELSMGTPRVASESRPEYECHGHNIVLTRRMK